MTIEDLREKVRLHGLWLAGDPIGQRANLQGAYLRGANLQGANLQDAHLQGAYLRGAYLRGANLQGADLKGADLQGADLDQKPIAAYIHQVSIVPECGPFWAWKAVRCKETRDEVIIQLDVPATAQRLGGLTGRKCRVSEAIVLNATRPDGTPFVGEMVSDRLKTLAYRVGEAVVPDRFDPNPADECSNGIHVFMNRLEAVAYFNPDVAQAQIQAILGPPPESAAETEKAAN